MISKNLWECLLVAWCMRSSINRRLKNRSRRVKTVCFLPSSGSSSCSRSLFRSTKSCSSFRFSSRWSKLPSHQETYARTYMTTNSCPKRTSKISSIRSWTPPSQISEDGSGWNIGELSGLTPAWETEREPGRSSRLNLGSTRKFPSRSWALKVATWWSLGIEIEVEFEGD